MKSIFKYLFTLFLLSLILLIYLNETRNKKEESEMELEKGEGRGRKNHPNKKKIAILIPHQEGHFNQDSKLFFLTAKHNLDYQFIFFINKGTPSFDFALDFHSLVNIKFISIPNHSSFFVHRIFSSFDLALHPLKQEWINLFKKYPHFITKYYISLFSFTFIYFYFFLFIFIYFYLFLFIFIYFYLFLFLVGSCFTSKS